VVIVSYLIAPDTHSILSGFKDKNVIISYSYIWYLVENPASLKTGYYQYTSGTGVTMNAVEIT
jgi:hypothetical protein